MSIQQLLKEAHTSKDTLAQKRLQNELDLINQEGEEISPQGGDIFGASEIDYSSESNNEYREAA